jgi:HSP20 family protein
MGDDRRKNLRDVLDELDRFFEEFEKDITETVRQGIDDAKRFSKPYVAGFSMKVGPEGKPTLELFGDKPEQDGGFRSPMTEQILDGKNKTLVVVLEMPGVDKRDIEISSTDDSLLVKAEHESRKYKCEVALKADVEPDSGKAEYRNGILEITFSVRDKDNKGFRRVSVV